MMQAPTPGSPSSSEFASAFQNRQTAPGQAAASSRAWFWLALALCAALLAGCQSAPQDASGDASTDSDPTMVVAYSIDMEGVNELLLPPTAIHSALQYFAMFLPLLEEQADYQEGPPSFAPRLAESYTFSEDRLQVTLKLRSNVVWSDGVPVTAEDVRWTWQAQMDPDVAWNYVDSKHRIRDVEVVDPHTVVFHFTESYPSQLLDINQGVVLPKHAWSQLPFDQWRDNNEWFTENLVVNGPFTLESWEPQQRFVLARNESYFEPGIPKMDRIVFEVTREPQAQLAKLRAGQAHLVEFVTPSAIASLEAEEHLELSTYITRFFFFVTWNTSRPQFADPTVRQALTLAIDRQTIIDSLYYGYASLSHSPFPSNTWVFNKDVEPWPFDPSRAKELLAEAGWEDRDGDGIVDKDGQPFEFELVTNSENQVRRDIVVMIQEMLSKVGIRVETRLMEFNALIGPLSTQNFDAAVSGLAMDTSFNTRFFFHSDAIQGGYNWGAYSNPRLDELVAAIESESDLTTAKAMFDEMQVILHNEQPLTILYQGLRVGAHDKRLEDYEPNAINSFFNMRHWRWSDT